MNTSQKRSYSVIENERFGLVFSKTGSKISGTGVATQSFFLPKVDELLKLPQELPISCVAVFLNLPRLELVCF